MPTFNRLDLESLGSWPTLYAQKLPGHWFQLKYTFWFQKSSLQTWVQSRVLKVRSIKGCFGPPTSFLDPDPNVLCKQSMGLILVYATGSCMQSKGSDKDVGFSMWPSIVLVIEQVLCNMSVGKKGEGGDQVASNLVMHVMYQTCFKPILSLPWITTLDMLWN